MVPSAFVVLASFPLTPNGKVDREALPDPGLAGGRDADADDFVPPRGPIEEALAEAWAELLGGGPVGAHDNFFDRGGHSLMALQLLARARQVFDVEVPLMDFIERPTLVEPRPTWSSGPSPTATPPHRPSSGPTAPAPCPPPSPSSGSGSSTSSPRAARRTMSPSRSGSTARSTSTRSAAPSPRSSAATRSSAPPSPTTAASPARSSPTRSSCPCPSTTSPGSPRTVARSRALERILAEAARPFDLARGPLVRAGLLRLGEDRHIVQVTMHHIASDGWSLGVLVREVSALYDAFRRGEPSPLPEPAIQYADFAAWQRAWLRGDVLQGQLDYWTGQLAGLQPLELPTDRPRPAVPSGRGAERTATIPRELARRVAYAGTGRGGHAVHDPAGRLPGPAPPLLRPGRHRRRLTHGRPHPDGT